MKICTKFGNFRILFSATAPTYTLDSSKTWINDQHYPFKQKFRLLEVVDRFRLSSSPLKCIKSFTKHPRHHSFQWNCHTKKNIKRVTAKQKNLSGLRTFFSSFHFSTSGRWLITTEKEKLWTTLTISLNVRAASDPTMAELIVQKFFFII